MSVTASSVSLSAAFLFLLLPTCGATFADFFCVPATKRLCLKGVARGGVARGAEMSADVFGGTGLGGGDVGLGVVSGEVIGSPSAMDAVSKSAETVDGGVKVSVGERTADTGECRGSTQVETSISEGLR